MNRYLSISQAAVGACIILWSGIIVNGAPAADEEDFKCFLDPKPEVMNAALACIAKAGVTELDYGGDKIVANNYEDKCLADCFFKSMKLVDDSGEPIVSAMEAQIMGITPEKNQAKAKAGLTSCLTSTKEQITKEGGIKAAPCKYAAMLVHCAAISAMDMCMKP